MPAQDDDLINRYVDRNGIDQDTVYFTGVLNSMKDKINAINQNRVQLNISGSFKDASDATNKLADNVTQLSAAQKAYNAIVDDTAAKQTKLTALDSDAAKTNADVSAALKQKNKDLRDSANAALEVSSAYQQLQKDASAATRAAQDIGIEKGLNSDEFVEASNKAAELNQQLKSVDEAVGYYYRNVGNYAKSLNPAFDVLTEQLEKLKAGQVALLSVTARSNSNNVNAANGANPNAAAPDSIGAGLNPAEIQAKIDLINGLLTKLRGGFSTTRSELIAFQDAANKLGLSFGEDSEEFQLFNEALGKTKGAINDIQAATRFQAQDDKVFKGIIEGINGLTGAYAAASGAVQLFGDGTEESAKKLAQFEALLQIIIGLQQVANALDTKAGDIQLLLSARTALNSAAKKTYALITNQAVTSIVAEAVANNTLAASQDAATTGKQASAASSVELAAANQTAAVSGTELAAAEGAVVETTGAAGAAAGVTAVETTGLAVAEGAASAGALTLGESLTAAFIATGIGAIIVLVAAAVYELVEAIKAFNAASTQTQEQQQALEQSLAKYEAGVIALTNANDNLYAKQKLGLQNQLDAAQANKVSQEELLVIKQKIADLDNKQANQKAGALAFQIDPADLAKGVSAADILAAKFKTATDNAKLFGDAVTQASLNLAQLETLTDKQKLERDDSLGKRGATDFEIKQYQDEIKTNQAKIDNAKTAADEIATVQNNVTKSQADQDDALTEHLQYNAEQLRKYKLALLQAQLTDVQTINDAILANERSSVTQRVSAIQSNADSKVTGVQAKAQYDLAQPEVQNDPKAREEIAIKEASDILAIQTNSAAALRDLGNSERAKELDAINDYIKAKADRLSTANQAIYNDESQSLDARLDAYKRYQAAQKIVVDSDYNTKLLKAGFSNDEIAQINAGFKVETDGKLLNDAQLEALEETHQAQLAKIDDEGGKAQYDITLGWAKKMQKDIDNINEATSSAVKVASAYGTDLTSLNNQFINGEIGLNAYHSKLTELNNNYSVTSKQAAVNDDQQKLDAEQKFLDTLLAQQIEYQKDAEIAAAEGDDKEIARINEKYDAITSSISAAQKRIKAIQEQSAKDGIELTNAEAAQKDKLDQAEQQAEIKDANAAIDLAKQVADAIYEARISNYQKEIAANDARTQKLIDAENNSLDSAQDKADKINAINAKSAEYDQDLQNKALDAKRKEAEFDKIAGVAKVIISTAVAEAKVFEDFPFPAAVPLAIAVGALGAIEIATILAAPLPTARYGREVGGGEYVEVGHGRPEPTVLPSGEAFLTKSTPHVLGLPKGTTIYPDLQTMINKQDGREIEQDKNIGYAPTLAATFPEAVVYPDIDTLINAALNSKPDINIQQEIHAPDVSIDLKKHTDRIVQAIEDKEELHFNQLGFYQLQLMRKHGENWVKWVHEQTQFKH